MKNELHKKIIVLWLLLGCFLIFAMVIIGGLTRLTHSGLSMVNWSIFGSTPPASANEWDELFDKYKQYPEYQQINFNFTVAEFKHIFWWEYSHRLLGRLIGVLFLIPFIVFYFLKMLPQPLLKRLLVLLGLGAFQGLLGWYMVKSGLNHVPRVSHYRLAAHFGSALTLFGFTFWTALSLSQPKTVETTLASRDKRLSYGLFALVLLQIIYGAFVAGLKAGTICPTWPTMCGEWVHDAVFVLQPVWLNFIEGPAGVQFVHRTIGALLVCLTLLLSFRAMKFPREIKNRFLMVLFVLIGQFILGIFTLINAVPLLLGVAHQIGAFFLLTVFLFYLHGIGRMGN